MVRKSRSSKQFALVFGALSAAVAVPRSSAWVVPPPPAAKGGLRRRITALAMSQGKSKKVEDRTDAFLDFINEPMPTTVDPAETSVPPYEDDLAPRIRTMAAAADSRKAEDIIALRVSKCTATTSWLLICSGSSRPQNSAIAAAIQDDVEEMYDGLKTKSGGAEGTADSGWMLLDYGDVMVHIMTPRSRLFYDIEGQWRERGAEELDLTDVLLPNGMVSEGEAVEGDAELGGAMGGLSEEEDPFWS